MFTFEMLATFECSLNIPKQVVTLFEMSDERSAKINNVFFCFVFLRT